MNLNRIFLKEEPCIDNLQPRKKLQGWKQGKLQVIRAPLSIYDIFLYSNIYIYV